MVDLRDDLRQREDTAIDRLVADAKRVAMGAISATMLAASKKALAIATKVRSADDIMTSAEELKTLRADPGVHSALADDLAAFGEYLAEMIPQWLADGWIMQAEGQAAIIEAEGQHIQVHVELTDDDRAELSDFSMMGYTAKEIRVWLVNVLRHDIEGALGMCLNTTGADAILGQFGQAQQQNATRVATQCRQCFLAGCGAARDAIARALIGG